MQSFDIFDIAPTQPALCYLTEAELTAEHISALDMLRLAVDRYDLVEARYYNRRLDRVEHEFKRRRN